MLREIPRELDQCSTSWCAFALKIQVLYGKKMLFNLFDVDFFKWLLLHIVVYNTRFINKAK